MNDQTTISKRGCRLTTRIRRGVAAVAACFAVAPALSNPVNPVVVSGSAVFSQVGKVLTVTNSNGAIINWEKFSINAGETTHFAQPSASSSVLNKVLNDPSAIYGTLSSNGRVWLINPAGIMVGSGGRVDTAGFVASTLNIRNEDFLAGRKLFEATPGAGNVLNQGEIRTPAGGSVYLIGTNAGNEGIIHAPGGETILAAGATVSLIDTATPGVKVEITGAEGNSTNLGAITAEAGRVGIAGVVVRNSGLISASSAVSEGGRVFLKASRDAYVDGNGRIVTTGTKGGRVEVLGERVAVADSASIDASGTGGGGKILIGGDYQGSNPEVGNANISYVGSQASLRADATEVGAGGTVIVWADDTTRVHGQISARGGADGGNGGFVETSGKRYLDVTGARIDTSAAKGSVGTWLLDPTDIEIHGGAGTTTGIDMFGVPTAATATVYAADINTNLATTDVMLSTASAYGGTGNITVHGDVVIANTSGTARSLALEADGNIILQHGSVLTGSAGSPLSVAMGADSGTALLAGAIKTFGGDVVVSARDGITLGDGVNTTPGSFGINARRDGAAGSTQTYDTAGNGGRILLDADSNRDGVGNFIMNHGAFIGTTSSAHLLDASGNIGAYGSAKVAVGIIAADVELAGTATIKLNYDATASAGAPFGGGDIAFLPTATGEIRLGNYSTLATHFTLDNAELTRIFLPANGASNCGTGQEGCRLWIGNSGVPNDPIAGVLPHTTQNIKLDQADFTLNGATTVPKRVHLSIASGGDINDAGSGAGYFGVKAGHLSLHGASGVGGSSGVDGIEFIANSVSLMCSASGIKATSVGGGDLALRRVTGNGDINLKVLYGGVTLLPYFAGQTETTTGNFNLTVDDDIRFAALGSAYTINGPLNTFTETAPGTATIRALGTMNLVSNGGSVQVAGDQAASGGLYIHADNGISITDGGLATSGDMGLTSNGDLVLNAVNRGTIIKSGGEMIISVANLRAYGGSAINAGTPGSGTIPAFQGSAGQEDLSGWGAGVSIKAGTSQHIDVGSGEIRLQAGTAANAGGHGGTYYGGSVGIHSAGTQYLRAANITLIGGAGGHDNMAEIQAVGDQTITLYGGTLQLVGGGGTGGFNNQARIQHGQWTAGVGTGSGNQTILVNDGGTINLVAGSGTGTQGYYGSDCYAVLGDSCRGGSNDARIENLYLAQSIDFSSAGGYLNITGGSAGNKNSASIENQTSAATTQQILGNPHIVLTGGSAGGSALSHAGKNFDLSNDAGIYSDGSGLQSILASSISIDGGTADVGGAGISNESGADLLVQTAGDLTMTGGSSILGTTSYGGAVYIANRDGGLVSLVVGGSLTVTAGSGTSAPALIGTIEGQGNVSIVAGGNVNLTAGGSFAMIGSNTSAYGAEVTVSSNGSITLTDSATRGVRIGSLADSSGLTTVSLVARGDVSIGSAAGYGALVGVATPTAGTASVEIISGFDGYGGDIVLDASSRIKVGSGTVDLRAIQDVAGSGNISLTAGGTVTGGAITLAAGGDLVLAGNIHSAPSGGIKAAAGVDAGGGTLNASAYGGDVTVSGDLLATSGDISLYARAGSTTNVGGNITQTTDGFIAGDAAFLMAQADLDLQGSVTSDSNASIYAYAGVGYDGSTSCSGGPCPNPSYASHFGGNLTVGGLISSSDTISLAANIGTADPGKGHIDLEAGGRIEANGDISLTAGQNITLTGDVEAVGYLVPGNLSINAGATFSRVPTNLGGKINVSGSLYANDSLSLIAESGASGGTTGFITQTADYIQTGAGNLEIIGGGNISLGGNVVAAAGEVLVKAGFSDNLGVPTNHGGNLSIDGLVSSASSLDLIALTGAATGLRGAITQADGSTISGAGITIVGSGDVSLSGAVAGASSVLIKAGWNSYTSTTTMYGGDLVFGATSDIQSDGGLDAYASAGSVTATGGHITQAGSMNAEGNVFIDGDRDVTINGNVTANGRIELWAGWNETPYYGGSLEFGTSSNVAAYGGDLLAYAIGASESAGDIRQLGGSLYSSQYLTLAADGNVDLNGRAEATVNLHLYAGIDNYNSADDPGLTSAYGGNVLLRGDSELIGDHVGIYANQGSFPDGTTGHVIQASGATLTVIEGMLDESLAIYAAGNVTLGGSVTVEAGESVTIGAGFNNITPLSQAFGDRTITVASLATNGSPVSLSATGSIEASIGDASSITANIANSSSGGIVILHEGSQTPATLTLTDNATTNSAVSFSHTGSDLVLTANHAFLTQDGQGDVFVAAPQNSLTVSGTPSLHGGSSILAAGGSLNVSSKVDALSGDLGLSAGSAINVNSGVEGGNLALSAPTINILTGAVTASADAILLGGTTNVAAGASKVSAANVFFGGGTLNLFGGVDASGQIEFNLASIFANGGNLSAMSPSSNITGFVSGDMTLTNASYFEAGDDISISMTGPASTLSLLSGSYLLADANSPPGSIYLDFTKRESGGLVIAGAGSGLFVGNTSTPATAGAGLHLAYAPPAAGTTPAVVNELNRATENADTTKPPTDDSAPPAPTGGSSGSGQPLTSLSGTTGGGEGTFGGDSGDGVTPGGTGSTGTGSTGGSGGTSGDQSGSGNSTEGQASAANTKDEAGGKTEKTEEQGKGKEKDKDDKDKDKEKKDQSKEEKKDEKPAQKKVAQCS